ncbi:MAG: hypothetical protein ABI693_01095 [Bryobacteraceae bacterium]
MGLWTNAAGRFLRSSKAMKDEKSASDAEAGAREEQAASGGKA